VLPVRGETLIPSERRGIGGVDFYARLARDETLLRHLLVFLTDTAEVTNDG